MKKKYYWIVGIIVIIILAFLLMTNIVNPLDKSCDIDSNCVLAYTGLEPCGPCDGSSSEMQCVSLKEAEELQNRRDLIGSRALCYTCPMPTVFYRCVCRQNTCEKTASCSADADCGGQALSCVDNQCKYVGTSECERSGGKCYGFGDFVAENCEDHGMITLPYTCNPITVNTQCCSYGE